jgi:hypothetical protein
LKFFQFLFLVFLFLTLAACGPVKDFKDQLTEVIVGQDPIDPPAYLKEFKAKLNPKILWSLKLGGSETFEFSPNIIGEEVYAASSDGSLAKIDLKTGKIEALLGSLRTVSKGTNAQVFQSIMLVSEIKHRDADGNILKNIKASNLAISCHHNPAPDLVKRNFFTPS